MQLPLVAYMNADVSGLTPGAPVNLLGIQVGDVTGVSLQIDRATRTARVRVAMQVQPDRVLALSKSQSPADVQAVFQHFVDHGMRVELGTESMMRLGRR